MNGQIQVSLRGIVYEVIDEISTCCTRKAMRNNTNQGKVRYLRCESRYLEY